MFEYNGLVVNKDAVQKVTLASALYGYVAGQDTVEVSATAITHIHNGMRVGKAIRRSLKAKDIALDDTTISNMGEYMARTEVPDCWKTYGFREEIDWDDGDFGDDGSCYWGDYASARTSLECDPQFHAMTFWNEHGYGSGRAWILERSGIYWIFNGYCDEWISNVSASAAAILAVHLTEATQRLHVALHCYIQSPPFMYINSNSGYAILPADMAIPPQHLPEEYGFTKEYRCKVNIRDVEFVQCDDDSATCEWCGDSIYREDGYWVEDCEYVCEDCSNQYTHYCDICHTYHHNDNCTLVNTGGGDNEWMCGKRMEREGVFVCEECNEMYIDNQWHVIGEDTNVCEDCFESMDVKQCVCCDEYHETDTMHATKDETEYICQHCKDSNVFICCQCDHIIANKWLVTHTDGNEYCDDCHATIQPRLIEVPVQ